MSPKRAPTGDSFEDLIFAISDKVRLAKRRAEEAETQIHELRVLWAAKKMRGEAAATNDVKAEYDSSDDEQTKAGITPTDGNDGITSIDGGETDAKDAADAPTNGDKKDGITIATIASASSNTALAIASGSVHVLR